MAAKKPKNQSNTIVLNKRARFDYHLHEKIEAGLVLEGWEVKALREKNAQLVDSYVFIQKGEAYLSGCNLTPTASVSTHIKPEPQRTRKLLMHRKEIDRLVGGIQKKRTNMRGDCPLLEEQPSKVRDCSSVWEKIA